MFALAWLRGRVRSEMMSAGEKLSPLRDPFYCKCAKPTQCFLSKEEGLPCGSQRWQNRFFLTWAALVEDGQLHMGILAALRP